MPSTPSPTEKFSQLFLDTMPPTTRLQSRQQDQPTSESEDWSSPAEGDSSLGEGWAAGENYLTFPSKIRYSIENLDEDTQNRVFKAWNDPSQLVLQQCQAREQFMIFRVSELTEHTIQTGSAHSKYPHPTCSCEEPSPCRHILWLFDQITHQIFDYQGHPLTMNHHGYADELDTENDIEHRGCPYNEIAQFHLDVLAHSLHTNVKPPTSTSEDKFNSRRVQEVREILASLHETPIDEYRPDLFEHPREARRVVKKNDLECTVFRMLCQNNEFFHYFRTSTRTSELVNNPFRRLQQRADFVLAQFDAYARNPMPYASPHPNNVLWCAKHLNLIEQHVRSAISDRRRVPKPWEYREAARTLVQILGAAVERHQNILTEMSLYIRLFYRGTHDFVVPILKVIPSYAVKPQVSQIRNILVVMRNLETPVEYTAPLADLCAGAEGAPHPVSISGSKRRGGGHDRKAKRMK
jgi:hypothetical protein